MRLDANRLKTLTIIACKWNANQLDPNDAMIEIWDLFREENLVTWNAPSFIQSLSEGRRKMSEEKCPVCNDPLWFFHGVGEDDCICETPDKDWIGWRKLLKMPKEGTKNE